MSEGAPKGPFAPGAHTIDAYGGGGFGFAGMSHQGSILATPKGIVAVEVASVGELEWAHFQPLLDEVAADPALVEFLVIGTGANMARLPKSLDADLRARRLRFEVMATGPAIRMYNVMREEGRRVAALLIAAP